LICIKLGQVHRENVRSRKRPVLPESGKATSKPSAGRLATAAAANSRRFPLKSFDWVRA
jgi:hypothetical protein